MADATANIATLRLSRRPRSVTALSQTAPGGRWGLSPSSAAEDGDCTHLPADGLPLALEQEWADVKSARQALAAALEQCQILQADLIRQSESQLVELALEIAAKVLLQEIRADRVAIDPIVKEALARVPARRDAVVRLNPADLERCSLAGESKDARKSVRFVADSSLPRTQCVVETTEGFIHTDIASHLQAIAAQLREGF